MSASGSSSSPTVGRSSSPTRSPERRPHSKGWAPPAPPKISAVLAASIELGGGILLIAGLLTPPLVGALLFLDMVGAFFIVHADKGVFIDNGGYELVVALGVGSLLIAVIGAGRISIDGLIGKGNGWVKTPPA